MIHWTATDREAILTLSIATMLCLWGGVLLATALVCLWGGYHGWTGITSMTVFRVAAVIDGIGIIVACVMGRNGRWRSW